jgi:hypothetical protein
MLSKPAPEPYSLPLSIRITRNKFIANSVICPVLIAFFLGIAVFTYSPHSMGVCVLNLLIAAGLGLSYLDVILQEIRLTDDRISYRKWFFWKEMEYSRITAIRFYYRYIQHGVKLPMLALSGDTGDKITINLGMFDSPANLGIIYDVLNKNSPGVDISDSPEEFFTDPGATALKENMRPEPYTLPLILRVNRGLFLAVTILCLPVIPPLSYFIVFANPPVDIVGRVVMLLVAAFFLLWYLYMIMPAILLTDDKISYRERFFWKDMGYTRITAVRFYYTDTRSTWTSGPVLELSGDNGDRITMKFGVFISPANLPIVYDVLKKKASLADLQKSPEEFFAHPGS